MSLLQEKPMLYMAIMVVACQSDTEEQVNLAKNFRDEISSRMLVRIEHKLGLLEGLLVFLAW